MGAAGSGSEGLAGALPDAAVRKRLVLTGVQRGALEEKLFEAGAMASPVQSSGSGESGESSGETRAMSGGGGWVTFYDNEALALSKRGWWLCKRDGSEWSLHVPTLVADGYEELTEIGQILERSGLPSHAEALRKGHAKNVDRLWAQAGVIPFARVHIDSCQYGLQEKDGKLVGGSAEDSSFALILHQLKLDVNFAEAETIANLLFSQGTGARGALEVSLAELARAKPKEEQLAGGLEAEAALCAALFVGGFDLSVSAKVPRPEVVAYVHALRPKHMRALRASNVILVDEEEKKG